MEKQRKDADTQKETEKGAMNLLRKTKEQAKKLADTNGDGKLDFLDIAEAEGKLESALKKGSDVIREKASQGKRYLALKALQPVFPSTLDEVGFIVPKLLRLTPREKKFFENDVCKGAIGYFSDNNGLRVLNVFEDAIKSFDLEFYPDSEYEFYYIDPTDRDRYIALDEYFGHLKVARINELQRVAQDLGAKHFKVTYKEERTSFSDNKIGGKIQIPVAKAEAKKESSKKTYSTVEIAAEMEFPGHAPTKPELHYMQKEQSIQSLIAMRMNESSPLLHQKYLLKLSNSSGIKENEAIKIDAALKNMKCTGNASVASEAKNESRRYLEYEIDF